MKKFPDFKPASQARKLYVEFCVLAAIGRHYNLGDKIKISSIAGENAPLYKELITMTHMASCKNSMENEIQELILRNYPNNESQALPLINKELTHPAYLLIIGKMLLDDVLVKIKKDDWIEIKSLSKEDLALLLEVGSTYRLEFKKSKSNNFHVVSYNVDVKEDRVLLDKLAVEK